MNEVGTRQLSFSIMSLGIATCIVWPIRTLD